MSKYSEEVEPTNFMFIQVSKSEVESGDISSTLQKLNQLITDKTTILKHRDALSFDIVGYEDNPKELFEIRDVQNFMKKLDREFPYWFYFLSNIDNTLAFILFAVCNHYKESSSNEWRVQREIFWKFMNEHFTALNKILDLAVDDDEAREILRDEIITYFERINKIAYYTDES